MVDFGKKGCFVHGKKLYGERDNEKKSFVFVPLKSAKRYKFEKIKKRLFIWVQLHFIFYLKVIKPAVKNYKAEINYFGCVNFKSFRVDRVKSADKSEVKVDRVEQKSEFLCFRLSKNF